MIKSRLFFISLFSLYLHFGHPAFVLAGDGEKSDKLDHSAPLQLHGEYLLEYLWVDVYRAELFLPTDFHSDALSPSVSKSLQLTYLYPLKTTDLIEAAWLTLERQHNKTKLDALRSEIDRLHSSFEPIKREDRYRLNYRNDSQTLTLLFNGREVFRSQNPELAQVYLGIWLGEKGLSKELRSVLLGL
ncbi:Chalcone isomerase-like [Atopomonas hussainii]|uniref:Chalcone isomerase-like n=1 Tax=Atopomonas hussainii TaxID=1429083 RepID=A0A1H7MGJ9_9GAMM|nr:chalcone isomerase family protein [Atopomonas hussainii]SEL10373.1 Chalcone isomerase-like [Atopomonas hussainii]